MPHPLITRALIGGAGLAGCLALLSGVARAADSLPPVPASYQNAIIVRAAPIAPNLFGTVTLPIKPERYYEDWERARRSDMDDPRMRALIAPAQGLNALQKIDYVQSAVNKRIHWMSDATQWGYQDYWASAAETLKTGFGDEDDRAIVKMQALRALGFPDRDVYLTLGRDSVEGPIIVLLARVGGRVYVLDDTGGAPYLTESRPEFQPTLTFGYGAFWIHGHRMANSGPLHVTATAADAAGVHPAH